MKFKDLDFYPHAVALSYKAMQEKGIDSPLFTGEEQQAIADLGNGYKISIIIGKCFYSNGVDTYEIFFLEKKPEDGDPVIGHLSKEEVEGYLEYYSKK